MCPVCGSDLTVLAFENCTDKLYGDWDGTTFYATDHKNVDVQGAGTRAECTSLTCGWSLDGVEVEYA